MLLAFTLLLIGSSTVSAVETGFMFHKTKNIVPVMMTTATKHDCMQTRMRMLEVSDQCLADTDALYNTPELSNAFSAWEAELAQLDFDDVCFLNADAGTLDCTLDSTLLLTHEAATDACGIVGGNTYLYSDTLGCTITENGMTLHISINFVDIPECVADTCNLDELSEELNNIASEAAQYYEDELSRQFDNVQCSLAVGLYTKVSFGIMSVLTAIATLMD